MPRLCRQGYRRYSRQDLYLSRREWRQYPRHLPDGPLGLLQYDDDRRRFPRRQALCGFRRGSRCVKCREKYKKEELLIERDAGFGRNILSTHDNFNCPSICDLVVLTPDNNVYPCIFLAKHGNEIGIYQDGKIYVDEKLLSAVHQYNGSTCFAKETCNEGKSPLVKRI